MVTDLEHVGLEPAIPLLHQTLLDALARVSHEEHAAARDVKREHDASVILTPRARLVFQGPKDAQPRRAPRDIEPAGHPEHLTSMRHDPSSERGDGGPLGT